MNFSFYIAKRYLFSKSSNNAINIITIIATVGVIVGSLALFLVLSVFSGLKAFSSNYLNATDPDIRISAVKGKSFLFSEKIKSLLDTSEGIDNYTKIIEERAFFNYNQKEQIAYIKGVDSNYARVVNIVPQVYSGKWLNFNDNTAVIGNGISNKLALGVLDYGEYLNIYVPKPGKKYITNPLNAFNKIQSQAVGIFSVSEEIDNKYVFVPLTLAQELLHYEANQIGFIDIKAPKNSEKTVSILKEKLGSGFKIESRDELNAAFYKILNTEKLVAYLIFTLVLIIALFNVIGSLIMMIIDKKSNIKTLYNMGAPIKSIKKIFMLQGFLMSVFGLTIGISLGTILIFIQNKYALFLITSTIAYPIEFQLKNVIIVAITIATLGYIASRIASSRISKKIIP